MNAAPVAQFAPTGAPGYGFGVPGDISDVALPFSIVVETGADVAERDALLDRAMLSNWRRKSSEKIRRGRLPAPGLAFLARDQEGALVGTVRLWDVIVGDQGHSAVLLGPLAVAPSQKGRGVGSALMDHAIGEAARLGHSAIILVGDAPYYSRFGFSASKTGMLAMPGPFEPHRLLARELKAGALDGAKGVVRPAGRRVSAAGRISRLPVAA